MRLLSFIVILLLSSCFIIKNNEIYFKNLNKTFIHKISYKDESSLIFSLKLEIKGYSNGKGVVYYSDDPDNLRKNKILISQEIDVSRVGDWYKPYVYILYEPSITGNNSGEFKLSYDFGVL